MGYCGRPNVALLGDLDCVMDLDAKVGTLDLDVSARAELRANSQCGGTSDWAIVLSSIAASVRAREDYGARQRLRVDGLTAITRKLAHICLLESATCTMGLLLQIHGLIGLGHKLLDVCFFRGRRNIMREAYAE